MIYYVIGIIIALKIYILYSIFGMPKHSLMHLKNLAPKFNGSVSLLGILKGQFTKNNFLVRVRGEYVEISLYTLYFFQRKIAIFTQALGPVLFMRKISVLNLNEKRKLYIFSNQQNSKQLFSNEIFKDYIFELIRYCLDPEQRIFKNIPAVENQVVLKIKSKKISIQFRYNIVTTNEIFISSLLNKMNNISSLINEENLNI